MFQTIILAAHNVIRWIVLVLGIIALYRAYRGWLRQQPWSSTDHKAGVFFGSALDVQLLLGILLVILVGISNLGIYLFEHVLPMLLAIILAHVGSIQARKAASDIAKHKRAAVWYTAVFLVLLVAIPWYRPLLPGL